MYPQGRIVRQALMLGLLVTLTLSSWRMLMAIS